MPNGTIDSEWPESGRLPGNGQSLSLLFLPRADAAEQIAVGTGCMAQTEIVFRAKIVAVNRRWVLLNPKFFIYWIFLHIKASDVSVSFLLG
jgi:hypothetical protein